MSLPCLSFPACDILSLEGTVTVTELPEVTPELSRHIKEHPRRHLVLDLSRAEHIDSSTISLFVNIRKRMEEAGHKLLFLSPSESMRRIIAETHLDKVVPIADDIPALEELLIQDKRERYAPYCKEENGLQRLDLNCAVCGSPNVIGYLVDPHDFEWTWNEGSPFPAAKLPGSEEERDVFSIMPIVCTDCYMSSTDIKLFEVTEGTRTVYRSVLDPNSKLLLSKGIKKRKKAVEVDAQMSGSSFLPPRDASASYQLFTLAHRCARTIAVNRDALGFFVVGFLNYQAIKYAEVEQVAPLVDNCRTWLMQAIKEPSPLSHLEKAQSYLILMVSAINLQKFREATQMQADFTRMIESLPQIESLQGYNNPMFWHEQCTKIWKQEIESQSSALNY